MAPFGDMIKTADWKAEKHVPVIECPDQVTAGEPFEVKVSLGKEIAHPNTTEHHIRWIALYFQPEGGKFAYDLAYFGFNTHGESTEGANQGPAYTEPKGMVTVKIDKPGILRALAYCNIHGLWEGEKEIEV